MPKRLLTAVALVLLIATGCATPTSSRSPSTSLISDHVDKPMFTAAEIRYLDALAWHAAETAAFLQAVHQIRAAVPAQLRRIMWCEAGRYLDLPYPQTNYQAKTHGEQGASGGGQALGDTWRTWAREIDVDVARWPVAYLAPDWIQDLVLTHGYLTRGTSPWNPSSGCWR